MQQKARGVYESKFMSGLIASVLILNFVITVRSTLDSTRSNCKNNPGRGVPLRYSTSWNLHFWRILPLESEKLTFAIAPRLILGGPGFGARAF